ncbi:hypothetical protein TWF694_009301 [Orbilia ellipsospora]|uniref:Uncharacterized protein n=1 Tax=Orbilia ellipsospora TaxID=2528407 RepID=A0AAV9XFH2_9PEZI
MAIKHEDQETTNDLRNLSLQDVEKQLFDNSEDEEEELPSPPPTPPPPSKKRRRSKATTENDENKPPAGNKTTTKQTKQKVKKKVVKNQPRLNVAVNAEEIHKAFEVKFNTGKTPKTLKNRWFSIKDAVLLTGEEDKILTETIEEVMGDLPGTIIERFKGKTQKKVTKSFVEKKMKEGGHGGSGPSGASAGAVGKGKLGEEEDEE